MNNKKKDIWNLLFSAFLVIAFVICAFFFVNLIKDKFAMNKPMQTLMTAIVFTLFGLVLFYATRVGDGKQVFRFSPMTLIVLVVPSLYIILSSVITVLPFGNSISSCQELVNLAGVALGYGIPYTFLSGYELDRSQAGQQTDTNETDGNDENEDSDESDDSADDEDENPAEINSDELIEELDKISSEYGEKNYDND